MTLRSTVIILLGYTLVLSPVIASEHATTVNQEQPQQESSTSNKIAYWAAGVGTAAIALYAYYWWRCPKSSAGNPPPPPSDRATDAQSDDFQGNGKKSMGRVERAVEDIEQGTFGKQPDTQASGSGRAAGNPGTQQQTSASDSSTGTPVAKPDPRTSVTSPEGDQSSGSGELIDAESGSDTASV